MRGLERGDALAQAMVLGMKIFSPTDSMTFESRSLPLAPVSASDVHVDAVEFVGSTSTTADMNSSALLHVARTTRNL